MEKVQEFYNALQTDIQLKSKFEILGKTVSKRQMNADDAEAFIVKKVLPVAKEFGFDITFADLLAYENSVSELSENQLMQVSGGRSLENMEVTDMILSRFF